MVELGEGKVDGPATMHPGYDSINGTVGHVNESLLRQLLNAQRERPPEDLRVWAENKSYRALVPFVLFLVILNLLFPPVALNVPRNMPSTPFEHAEINLLASCNVYISALEADAQFDHLNLVGSLDAEHFLPQVLPTSFEVWIRNLGLDPTCNVAFKVAAGSAPNVTVKALEDSQVFIEGVTLNALKVETTGTSGGIYVSTIGVTAASVEVAAGIGKVSMIDTNVGNMDVTIEHRGFVDVQSETSAALTLVTRDDVTCMAAGTVADATVTVGSGIEGDAEGAGVTTRAATLHTAAGVANGTAATQSWRINLPSQGVTQLRVGSKTDDIGAANGEIPAGVMFENLIGAGTVATGEPTSLSNDARVVSLVGMDEKTFVNEHIDLIVLNASGTTGSPGGVFYLASRDVYTYLPLPVLQIVSGGVLQPGTETINAFALTCPAVPAVCTETNAAGVRSCTSHFESEPGTPVTAGTVIKPSVPLDPYFDLLKEVSEDVEVNGEDLWVGKPYSYEPAGDKGVPYTLSTRAAAAVAGTLCVRETPNDDVVVATGLCLEPRGMSANFELEAVLALSLALATTLAIGTSIYLIAIVAEDYTNKTRAALILSTPASRDLALGVLESFKVYAVSNLRSTRCGCCATRRMAKKRTSPQAADVEAALRDRNGRTKLGSKDTVNPNDLRIDRFEMAGMLIEPKISDLSNPSFVNKVEYVAQKTVIDKFGNLWGPPQDGNGAWVCGAPRGRLELLERPTQYKNKKIAATDVAPFAPFVPCSDDCNFPTMSTLASVSGTCGSLNYLFSDPPLTPEHVRGCKSTIKRFGNDQKKLSKFLHLLQYVNDQTHPFYLIDALFRSDKIPLHLDAARETYRYKLCSNCNEQPAAYLCNGMPECDGRKLCERCESVLHTRVPKAHKDDMIALRSVFTCDHCEKRRAAHRCDDCSFSKGGGKGSLLCVRCESVLHQLAASHKRSQLRVCDLCSIREGKPLRKPGQNRADGAHENRSGYYCSECSSTLARLDADTAETAAGEGGDVDSDAGSGGGSGARGGRGSAASGSNSVSSSAVTASGWDKTDVARRVFYQISHPMGLEIAVVVSQMALIIAPTVPLIVLSDVMLKSFRQLFGDSLGPAGDGVRAAATTFRAWAAMFMLFGGLYYVCAALYPTSYNPEDRSDDGAARDPESQRRQLKKKRRCCDPGKCILRCLNSACCRLTNQNHTNIYRFWYAMRIIFLILLALTMIPSLCYVVLVCLWVLLGVFISPEQVMPYAAGVVGAVVHAASMHRSLTTAYRQVFDGVKRGISEERLKEELGEADGDQDAAADAGSMLPEVSDTEVERWLARIGLSMANIAVAIASSLFVLVWALAFVWLGISAFSEPSTEASVINSGVVALTTVLVNRASSDDEEREDIETLQEKVLNMYRAAQSRDASGFEISVSENITSTLSRATEFFG